MDNTIGIEKIIKSINILFKSFFSFSQGNCKFEPTCSKYAIEAFQKKNFGIAVILIIWRILRCNPFNKGGYDPVSERK